MRFLGTLCAIREGVKPSRTGWYIVSVYAREHTTGPVSICSFELSHQNPNIRVVCSIERVTTEVVGGVICRVQPEVRNGVSVCIIIRIPINFHTICCGFEVSARTSPFKESVIFTIVDIWIEIKNFNRCVAVGSYSCPSEINHDIWLILRVILV